MHALYIVCVRVYVCVCVYVHVCVSMCVCAYVCVCVHVRVVISYNNRAVCSSMSLHSKYAHTHYGLLGFYFG